MMFVGFLGCYGAIQESQCLLGTVRLGALADAKCGIEWSLCHFFPILHPLPFLISILVWRLLWRFQILMFLPVRTRKQRRFPTVS